MKTATFTGSKTGKQFSGKWNGKVYGKKGTYNVYLDNVKTWIVDSEAEAVLNAQANEETKSEKVKTALNYFEGKVGFTFFDKKPTLEFARNFLIKEDGTDAESLSAQLTDEDIQNYLDSKWGK